MFSVSETVFLQIGPLFRRTGPRVSQDRTLFEYQRSQSKETPCRPIIQSLEHSSFFNSSMNQLSIQTIQSSYHMSTEYQTAQKKHRKRDGRKKKGETAVAILDFDLTTNVLIQGCYKIHCRPTKTGGKGMNQMRGRADDRIPTTNQSAPSDQEGAWARIWVKK